MPTADPTGPERPKDAVPSRARRAFLTIIGRTDELPTAAEVVAEANRRGPHPTLETSTPGIDSRARRAAAALAADGITEPTAVEVIEAANSARGDAAA